jgi:hypothetical protein
MVGIGPISFAQTRCIGKSQELQEQIDRIESLHATKQIHSNGFIKPFTLQHIVPLLASLDSSYQNADAIDKYSIEKITNAYLIIPSKYAAKRTYLKFFYKNPYTAFQYLEPNIIQLAINPLLNFQFGSEKNNQSGVLVNTRGVAVNGLLVNKIEFYASFCDNQERPLSYIGKLSDKQQAVPGVDYYLNKAFESLSDF